MCMKERDRSRGLEYAAGRIAGLEEAASAIRTHIQWLVARHGQGAPELKGSRLDLFCVEREIRLARSAAP